MQRILIMICQYCKSQIMKNTLVLILSLILFTTVSCEKDKKDDDLLEGIKTPFSEGILKFGIFHNDVELGFFVDQVDFTENNLKDQMEELFGNLPPNRHPQVIIEDYAQGDALIKLAMLYNMHQATVKVKNNVALAKVLGFGWFMEHLHNPNQNLGRVYLTTSTINYLDEEDREIFAEYDTEEMSQSPLLGTSIALNQYNKIVNEKAALVAGYVCDVNTFTSKTEGESDVFKIVAYTSPLFPKTINFSHPYYLGLENGIIQLDVYLKDSTIPTFTMKPKAVEPGVIDDEDLNTRDASPIYQLSDINWSIKSLQILMSGWSYLDTL